ncbi:multicopper oxidase family protein [Marinitenerispora sediminis]|uniref:Copper oxidase n=1 Tax=Marinitenerispora sediminis TaxID=1931232 RepID=A0A368TC85_9ACTN|nr:multicopper oxidase family protein [Marinitenerispora sediminis]RCV57959.1 copper oxidase [Marinitenerispora sediminis]RCV62308.1 copper oxidase [Marinitenerispora sediminis]RCV62560.1 copper oxidase [Marinitenerispora sediminis]
MTAAPAVPLRWTATVTALLLSCVLIGPARPAAEGAPAARGPELVQPPELVSEDGRLDVRLTVQEERVRLGARKVAALVYDGRFMPPTLRVRPGDRLDITLVNQASSATNLHTHGLHVSPEGHADNMAVRILPGEKWRYSYRFPEGQPPGTYWYHSHAHPQAEGQVFAGLAGAIVVEGLDRYLPPPLRGLPERLVALKDFQVRDGAIPTDNIDSNAPTTRTVNGLVNPTLRIRPGETQLWRLANMSANITYQVELPGTRFHVIAQDGNPLHRVWQRDRLLMPPASRYDVLVQGGPPGRTGLRTLAYTTGPAGDRYPQAVLATVVSEGAALPPARLPTLLAPFDDLRAAPVDRRRTVTFSQDKRKNRFFVNGREFDPERVDIRVRLGTTEEWTVRNDSDEEHAFHIHINPFQVISVNGRPYDARGRQDTVQLPVRGEVVIRTRFRDFVGVFPVHCHILNHEDRGMMANVEVVR